MSLARRSNCFQGKLFLNIAEKNFFGFDDNIFKTSSFGDNNFIKTIDGFIVITNRLIQL